MANPVTAIGACTVGSVKPSGGASLSRTASTPLDAVGAPTGGSLPLALAVKLAVGVPLALVLGLAPDVTTVGFERPSPSRFFAAGSLVCTCLKVNFVGSVQNLGAHC